MNDECKPVTPATTGNPGTRAIATDAATEPRKKVAKTYHLNATGKALPKRAEKMIVQHLLWKQRGNECYEKAKGLLKKALKETTGRDRREPVVTPGIVYQFSKPITLGDAAKRTFQIMDNFAMDDVSKNCRMDRFTINTWTGEDGPRSGRAATARDMAEQSYED